jgi:hypothetical protein
MMAWARGREGRHVKAVQVIEELLAAGRVSGGRGRHRVDDDWGFAALAYALS